MIKYFNSEKKFDLHKFLLNQSIIMMQYEDEDDLKKLTPKEFINKFTLYEGHIIDELFEVSTSKNKEEYITELVDVLMYVASAINLFVVRYENITLENEDSLIHLIDLLEDPSQPFNNGMSKNLMFTSFSDITVDVIDKLGYIRYTFPQRKWHKKEEEFSENIYGLALINSFIFMIQLCYDLLNYLLTFCEEHEINDIINAKQKKIVKETIENKNNEEIDNEMINLNKSLQKNHNIINFRKKEK